MAAKIGLDFGTTSLKVFVDEGDGRISYTTFNESNKRVPALIESIQRLEPEVVTYVGAGAGAHPYWFSNIADALPLQPYPSTDPIGAEIEAQVKGARYQLFRHPEGMTGQNYNGGPAIIVSIGTGVSYAVSDKRIVRSMIGNPYGGAALYHAGLNIQHNVRLSSLKDVSSLGPGSKGSPASGTLDLYLRDLIPALKGTPQGNLLASHFSRKNTSDDPMKARWRSEVDVLVVGIVKDLMDSRSLGLAVQAATQGEHETIADIIAIGGTLHHFPIVVDRLQAWLAQIGIRLFVPNHPAHCAAIGAALYAE